MDYALKNCIKTAVINNRYASIIISNTLCPHIWIPTPLIVFLYKFLVMETMVSAPVKLTPAAIQEVRTLMSAPGFEQSQYLRIGVKGGGCSGLSYVLGFDKREADDEIFDIEGIPVIMKSAHGIYLFGMEVDYSDGLNARGFVFKNPNASATCGCGSSFAV
jgi:iron-sulfur cluster assembly protein